MFLCGLLSSGSAAFGLFGIFIVVLVQVTFAIPAVAAKKKEEGPSIRPMQFAIVRKTISTCEPQCPEWISASGTIVQNTPAQLQQILKKMGERRLPVVIDSNGGDVNAAMAMGRMIRKRGLDVTVGKTRFEGCVPADKKCKPDKYKDGAYSGYAYPYGAYCLSACPYVVAGGGKRLVGPWAMIGVHQITTIFRQTMITYKTRYQIIKGKKKVLDTKIAGRKPAGTIEKTTITDDYRKKLRAYFAEMDIDPAILDRMQAVPAADILILTQEEMRQFKLVTGLGDVGDMTSNWSCDGEPKPDNCIKLADEAAKL